MKKLNYIFIGLLLIIIIFILVNYLIKKRYIDNYNKLDSNRVNLFYQEPFIIYFGYNFEFPKEMKEVMVMKPEDPDFNYYLDRHFRDFLSRERNNRLINYIPLYNPDNFKREAYLILSTGIDGRIDNILNENDTVYISDFKERLYLYNPKNFSKIGDTLRPYYDYNYNILSYFFGKKDFLIEYINGVEYYKGQIKEILSLNDLIYRIESGKFRRKIFGYKGVVYKDTLIHNVIYLNFKNAGYTIKNQIYDSYYNRSNLNDTIVLIGTLKIYDIKKKEIIFDNCIPIKNDNISFN